MVASEPVHCADALRMASSNQSIATKSCACACRIPGMVYHQVGGQYFSIASIFIVEMSKYFFIVEMSKYFCQTTQRYIQKAAFAHVSFYMYRRCSLLN